MNLFSRYTRSALMCAVLLPAMIQAGWYDSFMSSLQTISEKIEQQPEVVAPVILGAIGVALAAKYVVSLINPNPYIYVIVQDNAIYFRYQKNNKFDTDKVSCKGYRFSGATVPYNGDFIYTGYVKSAPKFIQNEWHNYQEWLSSKIGIYTPNQLSKSDKDLLKKNIEGDDRSSIFAGLQDKYQSIKSAISSHLGQ
jgi:hypothetical protein